MAHRKQGHRFENDWTVESLTKARASEDGWAVAETIPVNVKIEGEHKVLSLEKAKEYIDEAQTIVVQDCICRPLRRNCDAPVHVCLTLNNIAERQFQSEEALARSPQRISKEEALENLRRSHEAGLVHMALSVDGGPSVNAICSCCSCCCAVLSSMLRFGLFPETLSADYTSVTDMSKCTGCGVCVDRCQFGAREMVDGELRFSDRFCFGCGLCVTKCPTGAIELVPHIRKGL